MRTLLIALLLLLAPLPARAGALEDLRAFPIETEATEEVEAQANRLVEAALVERTLDEVVTAIPSMPSLWIRYGLVQKTLPRLVRERPERVLEAVAALQEPRLQRAALAGAVLLNPEAPQAGLWVEKGMAGFPAELTYDSITVIREVEGEARRGNLGPLFGRAYSDIQGELLIRAATGLRPDLAVPALVEALEPYRYGQRMRGAVALAVLDRARALEVLGESEFRTDDSAQGALDWMPAEAIRAADFRGLPDRVRYAAEREAVERLGAVDPALAVARARGLEPGRFRGAALMKAAELRGAPTQELRAEAGWDLAADPAASLDELAMAVQGLAPGDPAARKALADLMARLQNPSWEWWRRDDTLDAALASAWSGELRSEMLRLPSGRFEVLHASWIGELDAAVRKDLASADLAALETRYASPAARTVLLYRAALRARDRALAAAIPAPQERTAALLELGDLRGAAASARKCPEPLQRTYWLVQVGDAAKDPALHREALEEMLQEMKRERPDELRWGSRVLLGQSLYDRANALQVAFTRVFDGRPADRAALAARLGKLGMSSYHLMPLYRYMAGREPRLLPEILKQFPETERTWIMDEFIAALLPQHPAEASTIASQLPAGEDRDQMHAMVAVSLGRQGQWDRALAYLEKHVPSRWTRSQALRYMAMQVAERDPARARALASAIPMTDARKLTLRDLSAVKE